MSSVNIVFFNVGNYVPFLDELERFYANNPKYDVDRIQNAAEVVQFLGASQAGILLFKITGKKDLQEAVVVLKALKKLIRSGSVKPACFSTIKNKKVETVLAKYGCIDILEPDTKAKTMSFKMDFWSKPIIAQKIKAEKAAELKAKKNEQANSKTSDKKKEDFQLVKPLELQSDFWLVKHKADYKKILKRYLVRLLGPSPFIGNWIELEPQPGDKQQTWKYVLKDPENKDYIVDDGAWFFYGAKPEFDWKIQRWNFPSEFPHLYFYTRDGKSFSRFKFEGDHVAICENSEFAKMREEMIIETCNSEFNFEGEKSEGEESENLDGDADTDNLGGNLEGKGTEADELGGSLEGKGSKADEIDGDPLSGKGSKADRYGEDPLSGKGSAADNLGGDPLSGKGTAADEFNNLDNEGKKSFQEVEAEQGEGKKHSTEHLEQNPLSGKGSAADSFGDDPLSGKGSTADEFGNLDNEGKKSFEEVKPDQGEGKKSSTDHLEQNPLSGKGSAADSFGEDPLSGKGTSADEFENLDNEGKKSFEEVKPDQGDPKRTGTDQLQQNPLSGKGGVADEFSDLDNGDKKHSTDKLRQDPLGGKSSTDELGGDPLSGKGGVADEFSDLDNGDKKHSTDKLRQDPLGGKTSTDELGADPLSGKGVSADEFSDLDNGDKKHSTDRLDQSPLGGKGSAADEFKNLDNSQRAQAQQAKAQKERDIAAAALFEELEKAGVNPQDLPLHPDGSLDESDPKLAAILDELRKQGHDPAKIALNQDGSVAQVSPKLEDPEVDQDLAAIFEELTKNGIDPEALGYNDDGTVDTSKDNLASILEDLKNKGIDISKLGIDDDGNFPSLAKKPQHQGPSKFDELDRQAEANRAASSDNTDFYGANGGSDVERNPGEEEDHYLERKKKLEAARQAAEGQTESYLQERIDAKNAKREAAIEQGEQLAKDLDQIEREEKERSLNDKLNSQRPDGLGDDDTRKNASVSATSGKDLYGDDTSKKSKAESGMLDALDGGLTDDSKAIGLEGTIGKANEQTDKPKLTGIIDGTAVIDDKPDLKDILGEEPKLNLESGELKVVLKQQTSAGNAITFLCEFDDFYEDELVTIAPKNSLKAGTEVTAEVTLIYSGKKIKVECLGTIEEVEDFSEAKDTLAITISEINKEKYETFMSLYRDRQGSINEFMLQAKGY